MHAPQKQPNCIAISISISRKKLIDYKVNNLYYSYTNRFSTGYLMVVWGQI